jgi:GDP-L-fucose synthase
MADFFYGNAAIANNLIRAAHERDVPRLLFLGSTCIYPRDAPQPMREDCLLTSALEPTNEGYALAKIGGLKLCQFMRRQYGRLYHSVMPTNLYGPGDNYHPSDSHVIPGLMRRVHEAKVAGAPSVVVWGTGSPTREFLFVDDLASACFHVLGLPDPPDWVNVGTGEDLSILDLVGMLKQVVGFEGAVVTDPTKPDGTLRKCSDVSLLRSLGWTAATPLREGLERTYRAFLEDLAAGTLRGAAGRGGA